MVNKEAYYAECNELVKRAHSEGKQEDILICLKHKGALIRVNGIMNAVLYSLKTPEIIALIKGLKNDEKMFDTYLVSDFAIAALDVMDIEKYEGDKQQILGLIDSKFSFMDDSVYGGSST